MPSTELLRKDAIMLQERAQAFLVESEEDNLAAGKFLLAVREMRRKVKAAFDPIVEAAHAAHKTAVAKRKEYLEPVERAERTVKRSIAAYLEAERRRREEEHRRRVAAEIKAAEDRRLEEAAALEAQGMGHEAEAILEEPAEPVWVEPVEAPAAAKGVSARRDFDFEVVDPDLLPRRYLVPDLKAIRETVKRLGTQAEIPGIRVFTRTSVVARGGR